MAMTPRPWPVARKYGITDPQAQTLEISALERGALKLFSNAEQGETSWSKLLGAFDAAESPLIL